MGYYLKLELDIPDKSLAPGMLPQVEAILKSFFANRLPGSEIVRLDLSERNGELLGDPKNYD